MVEREFEYRLKAGRTAAWAVLTGAGALWFAYSGLTNDRGLILFVIPLSQNAATVFYWVIAALAGLFAASAAVNVAGRAELRQRIAFTPDGLLVPKSKWA